MASVLKLDWIEMRKQFKSGLTALLEEGKNIFWDGNVTFQTGKGLVIKSIWKPNSEQTKFAFVSYRAHPKSDSFSIDIGWSTEMILPVPAIDHPDYFSFRDAPVCFESYCVSLRLFATGHDIPWDIISSADLVSNPFFDVSSASASEIRLLVEKPFRESLALLKSKGLPFITKVL